MGSFWLNLKFLFREFFARRPKVSATALEDSGRRMDQDGAEDRLISALPSSGTPKTGRRTRDLS